ncbi:MAG: STAS domain-containing protein [Deltaproteobacteria bacterium]|nr:STAS domain-containing protein [Deltaproteobacteria bacterium]
MEVSEEKKGDVLIVGVSGKLEVTNSRAFEERILAVIDAGERQLVVDLSRLDYVSSAGLRVFVTAAKLLNSANGKIVFCSLKEPVREVFDIAGFFSIFSVYDSQDEAVKSL